MRNKKVECTDYPWGGGGGSEHQKQNLPFSKSYVQTQKEKGIMLRNTLI